MIRAATGFRSFAIVFADTQAYRFEWNASATCGRIEDCVKPLSGESSSVDLEPRSCRFESISVTEGSTVAVRIALYPDPSSFVPASIAASCRHRIAMNPQRVQKLLPVGITVAAERPE